jgi:hypothetical protein
MKTKLILSIVISALITLSFTFIKTKTVRVDQHPKNSINKNTSEPLGGLELDDKY